MVSIKELNKNIELVKKTMEKAGFDSTWIDDARLVIYYNDLIGDVRIDTGSEVINLGTVYHLFSKSVKKDIKKDKKVVKKEVK